MNAPFLMAAPRAQVLVAGQGIRIDDRFAGRLVDILVGLVRKDERAVMTAFHDMVDNRRSGLGSPKAQKKLFERCLKAARHTIVAANLKTGNRRRFVMKLIRLVDTIDGRSGLHVILDQHTGSPTKIDQRVQVLLELSFHSLRRLIQRGAVTSVDDMVGILRSNWPALRAAVTAIHFSERTTWIAPVRLPTKVGYFVLRKMELEAGTLVVATTFVVPTGSKADWRSYQLEQLHEQATKLFTDGVEGGGDEVFQKLAVLFDDAALRLGAKEKETDDDA